MLLRDFLVYLIYNMAMRVLVIEDEVKVASFVSRGLEEEGYDVDVAYDGLKGLEALKGATYDIVLLDLMIPEIDGLEVLRRMRSWGSNIPVLIITAKTAKEDVVKGLDTGSDDYLTKPFSFDELLARIRALLRRSKQAESRLLEYGHVILDPYNRRLSVDSREIELTEKEFLIMEFMLKNAERPLTRNEIAEYVWQSKGESTNIVDVYVNFLRKKLDSISARRYIHTVRGTGYILREGDEEI